MRPTERARDDEFVRYGKNGALGGVSFLGASFRTFSYALHGHEEYAVGMTLRGVQVFRCGHGSFAGTPGSVIAINPGEIHDGHAGRESGYSYRMAYVPKDILARLLGDAEFPEGGAFFRSAIIDDTDLSARMAAMFDVLDGPDASSLEVVTAFTETMACLFARIASPGPRRRDAARSVNFVQDAMDYLRDNASRDITLEDLAARYGASSCVFLRHFRRVTGIPPHRFHIQCRVERARALIRSGMDLAETAASVGFYDQSHLNRRFREVCGITPGQYASAMRPPAKPARGGTNSWNSERKSPSS